MHFKDVLIPYHIVHLDDAQKNKYTDISIIKKSGLLDYCFVLDSPTMSWTNSQLGVTDIQ